MKDLNEEFVKACLEGRIDQATILLKHGADINAVNEDHLNALSLAVRKRYIEGIFNTEQSKEKLLEKLLKNCEIGNIEEVKILIDNGADLNAADEYDYTPLKIASKYGHTELANLLIDNGADVNYSNKNLWGDTALILASQEKHIEIVKLLIENGADLNASDEDDINALVWAVRNKDIEMIKLLIDAGADSWTLAASNY